jgi:mono/diheme cytochrome c family protein
MADRTPACRSWLTSSVSLLVVSFLLVACGGSDAANGSQGDESGGSEPVVEAQAIFIEVGCAECHGEQGEGVEGKGASLQGTLTILNAFQTRVRNGRGQAMPAFSEEEISDDEIEIIHEWLRNQ